MHARSLGAWLLTTDQVIYLYINCMLCMVHGAVLYSNASSSICCYAAMLLLLPLPHHALRWCWGVSGCSDWRWWWFIWIPNHARSHIVIKLYFIVINRCVYIIVKDDNVMLEKAHILSPMSDSRSYDTSKSPRIAHSHISQAAFALWTQAFWLELDTFCMQY